MKKEKKSWESSPSSRKLARMELRNSRHALGVAMLLSTIMLVATWGLLAVEWQRWSVRRAAWGRAFKGKSYCDPQTSPGVWHVEERTGHRQYLLETGHPNESQKDFCKHEYTTGKAMLQRKLRSGLKLEFWGDSTQTQLVGAVMCWLSGFQPGEKNHGVKSLPRAGAWDAVDDKSKEDRHIFWNGKHKCFNGYPEAQLKVCMNLFEDKFERKQVWDYDVLDECRFERLEFSWFIPTQTIQQPRHAKKKVGSSVDRFWVPPTVTFRWVGQANHLSVRLINWIESHQTQVFEADLLILSAGIIVPRKSSDAEYVKAIEVAFQTIHTYSRYFKNTDIVWLETNPKPPSGGREIIGDADFRREESIRLAEKYDIPVIRTYQLIRSSKEFNTEIDYHFPTLAEHRAQLVINYLTHHF